MDNLTLMVRGGSNNTDPDVTPPTVASLAPATAVAGSPDTPLIVTGTNFDDPSEIRFGGVPLATTWVSATELHATIPAAQLTTAGNKQVRVGASYKMFSITAVAADPQDEDPPPDDDEGGY